MKLDRNIHRDNRGKYALVLVRRLRDREALGYNLASYIIDDLRRDGVVDYGGKGKDDFFVIRVKDKYAGPALRAYALAVQFDAINTDDPLLRGELREYEEQINLLALDAESTPKRRPD